MNGRLAKSWNRRAGKTTSSCTELQSSSCTTEYKGQGKRRVKEMLTAGMSHFSLSAMCTSLSSPGIPFFFAYLNSVHPARLIFASSPEPSFILFPSTWALVLIQWPKPTHLAPQTLCSSGVKGFQARQTWACMVTWPLTSRCVIWGK